MQITQSIFLFKLTINKVISLKYNGDNSTNDAVNPVTLALHNGKSSNDVPFRKKNIFSKNVRFSPIKQNLNNRYELDWDISF